MLMVLWIAPSHLEHVREHPHKDDSSAWLLQLGGPLTLLLIVVLIWLTYQRGRLDRPTVRHVRTWACVAAGSWLVWVAAVVLTSCWLLGMLVNSYISKDVELAMLLGAVMFANLVATPFTAIGALVRLVRAGYGNVTGPAAPAG